MVCFIYLHFCSGLNLVTSNEYLTFNSNCNNDFKKKQMIITAFRSKDDEGNKSNAKSIFFFLIRMEFFSSKILYSNNYWLQFFLYFCLFLSFHGAFRYFIRLNKKTLKKLNESSFSSFYLSSYFALLLMSFPHLTSMVSTQFLLSGTHKINFFHITMSD